MNTKHVIFFFAGFVIGGIGTYFATKKKFEKQANEEIAEVKRYYKTEQIKKTEEAKEKVAELNRRKANVIFTNDEPKATEEINSDDILANDLDENSDEGEDEDDYPYVDNLYPREEVDHPYVINEDMFDQTMLHFDKSTLFWFVEDDIVTDENYEEIDDPDALIGDVRKNVDLSEDYGSMEQDSIYIRNEAVGADYELVIRSERYYK